MEDNIPETEITELLAASHKVRCRGPISRDGGFITENAVADAIVDVYSDGSRKISCKYFTGRIYRPDNSFICDYTPFGANICHYAQRKQIKFNEVD